MEQTTSYHTIKSSSEGIYKEKGSKFLGYAFPVHSEDEAKSVLEKLKKKYHDARHHCYAWVLGPGGDQVRMNDDGEPSGTAGKPILGQISSRNLTYIMVVVVRYFGGILLGTGGLVRAYREAASLALDKNHIVSKEVTRFYKIHFNYPAMNDVMKLLKEMNLKPHNQQFDETCKLGIEVPLKISKVLLNRLKLISSVQIFKEDNKVAGMF